MAGVAEGAGRALLAFGGLVRRAEVSPDGRALFQIGGREADSFYRDRSSYDKVVRSTHGVNCTSSTPPVNDRWRGRTSFCNRPSPNGTNSRPGW